MILPNAEKKPLTKYLNFCLAPKQLNYAGYLVHFEFCPFWTLVLPNEDLDFVNTKIKEAALSSFRQCNNNLPQNLSKEELAALTVLSKKDTVIEKSEKGNSVAITDKEIYFKRTENILSDQRKFKRITLKYDTFLNFKLNKEKPIGTIFKNLIDSNSISKEMWKSVKLVVTRPGTKYWLCKVQNREIDGYPRPFKHF